MNAANRQRRGWPLLSLGLVLGGWVLVRVAMWESPLASTQPPSIVQFSGEVQSDAGFGIQPADATAPASTGPVRIAPNDAPAELLRKPAPEILERPDTGWLPGEASYSGSGPRTGAGRAGMMGAQRIVAHSMLLAAAYHSGGQERARSPRPLGVGPVAPGVVFAPEAAREFAQTDSLRRWRMDVWAMWRDDTTTPVTSGRPSYGRSQAGAVLRYRLDSASHYAPEMHLRATRALQGPGETDVALGASARPIASLPVRLAAEARVSETFNGTELRGAAFAVTELAPVDLPAGLSAEAYLQGGYVSGDFATPFIDGQARIVRELARTDTFRLTAGGGAWGGAQDNARRLDVGPSAGISFRLGEAQGRVAADYRFRVAGNAEPASGPALTLTAGF